MAKYRMRGTVEIGLMDLSTLLGCLASDLRNTGLTVRALDQGRSRPGDEESRDLDRLGASLDRVAGILDTSRVGLCQVCRHMEISEQVRLMRAASTSRSRVDR